MYSEWASLQQEVQNESSNVSVLHKFPDVVGRDVAGCVVKNLAKNLSLPASSVVGQEHRNSLLSDKDVEWTMEILCYSLSLPLTEGSTVVECVNVYCDWLSALTKPKEAVPLAVQEDPNLYGQTILRHLQNLFVARPGSTTEQTTRQAVHCHRVLRVVQTIASNSSILTRETWECMLKFLLAINDSLLGPPAVKESLGEQICDRAVSVLFEVLLLACYKSFPSPPMWKTFRDMCAQWRHHEAVITHWHQVNVALLARVMKFMYGPNHPQLSISDDDAALIPEGMSDECVAQCWFRFLHILQNPVDLARPALIANTPKFLHHALTNGTDPEQQSCLAALPHIFHLAMKSVSVLVDASLGLTSRIDLDIAHSRTSRQPTFTPTGSSPPPQRKSKSQSGSKGFRNTNVAPARPAGPVTAQSVSSSHLTFDLHSALATTRPKVNSLLHLFGAWLIEAALVGVTGQGTQPRDESNPVAISRSRTTSFHVEHSPLTTASAINLSRHSTHLADDVSGSVSSGSIAGGAGGIGVATVRDSRDHNDAGRAEAFGTLCRIFCSKRTKEEILPEYLARFYFTLYHGLDIDKHCSGVVLTSIICNSCDLLRLDLDGVMMLLPRILNVLEHILPDLQPKFRHDEHVAVSDLRKASIHLLLSMLCLPLHFKTLAIKPLLAQKEGTPPVTFVSLKMRMMELVLRALTVETESGNTQMLLGGLMLCVQDLALCEEAEQTMQQEEQDSQGMPTNMAPDTADSAQGLFCHAASIVSNRLLASWKMDLNIALAAIEVLSGLAKVRLSRVHFLMGKRTVNWISEFILYQCSRPAPSHSKDLHSMIVAAFHCLSLWLVEHSYLTRDKECLQCVLEVLELGISGTKSQNRASDTPKLKGEKILRPVSMRVKDAAEGLLTVLMDHVGSFPPPCGPESLCSLLDESSLLSYCKDGDPPDQAIPFKYYVLEGSTIIALYEQPLGNNQDPLPTVTALIRGPFGRHAWTMQLRHEPRKQKVTAKSHIAEVARPTPLKELGEEYNIQHRHFPSDVDQVPLVQADRSISKLEWTLQDHSGELDRFKTVILNQTAFEENVKDKLKDEVARLPCPNPDTECKPPNVSHDLQTARLFLSHYGFLTLESLKSPSNSSRPPSLVKLRPGSLGLIQDLAALDSIPSRTADTVHVFYVKSGQKNPQEILANVSRKSSVQPAFLEFLRSLGWPVDIRQHAGWTGHVSTSWKTHTAGQDQGQDVAFPAGTGGSIYDGQHQVLYWSDVSTEMAFVVPSSATFDAISRGNTQDKSPRLQHSLSTVSSNVHDANQSADVFGTSSSSSVTGSAPRLGDSRIKSVSLDLEGPAADRHLAAPNPPRLATPTDLPGGGATSRRFGRTGTHSATPDTKVFVVWLESYEDWQNFPTGDLLVGTSTGVEASSSTSSVSSTRQAEQPVYVIYIHVLQSGLYRIHMQGQSSKMSLAIPLVDGMVVSRRSLGSLIRQTSINICRRKRLESDTYQSPHLRRKLKITEIVEKYACEMNEAEFYTSLFKAS